MSRSKLDPRIESFITSRPMKTFFFADFAALHNRDKSKTDRALVDSLFRVCATKVKTALNWCHDKIGKGRCGHRAELPGLASCQAGAFWPIRRATSIRRHMVYLNCSTRLQVDTIMPWPQLESNTRSKIKEQRREMKRIKILKG